MELDEAYSNAAYIPNAMAYPPKWRAAAAAFRANHPNSELSIAYGEGKRHRFDLFRPKGDAKGLLVFIHGGYWLDFDRSDWSNLAAGSVANGWAVAVPSYDHCPNAQISEITRQIAKAVTVAAGMVDGPIVITGHSAGGHLAARMIDRAVLAPEIGSRLQRIVPISLLADLRPLLKTTMNERLQLDQKEAAAESPVLSMNRYPTLVTVWVGGDERPSFLDQAQWLVDAWGADHVVDEGLHHFNVIEAMEDENSRLVRTLLS